MIRVAIESQAVESNSTVILCGLLLDESANSLNIVFSTGRLKAVVFFYSEFKCVGRNVSGCILND